MCLAVPGRLIERFESNNLQMGKIDFGGVSREVCLEYLPDLLLGEYAIVHVGFAISKLDEDAAKQTLHELSLMNLAGEPANE